MRAVALASALALACGWVPREGASASELEDPKQPLDLKQGFSCAAAPER
ncbi:MAG: hypothetical protein IPM35_33780 [Myxococcales bacterium]|nr:hypothetical protein [Myxococcales bacterium]